MVMHKALPVCFLTLETRLLQIRAPRTRICARARKGWERSVTLRIPLPEDDGFALTATRKGAEKSRTSRTSATSRTRFAKAVCEETKGQKRPRDFCVLFPYLSLFCLSGALACYLSLSGLSVVAHAARRKSICGACVFAGIGDRT